VRPPPTQSSAADTTAPAVAAPSRVGRDGRLSLRFERREAATVLTRCRYTLPLQVLAPVDLADSATVVSVLNPTGGLVGGDRLALDIDVGPGAHACLTTPSATRVYRTRGAPAEQHVGLRVGAGATLEWVPDHTIPHAGSALCQRIEVHLDSAARLILVDVFAAGRIARGEAWQFARLESAVSVRDPDGWLLRDRFVLAGECAWARLGYTESYPYFGSVLVAGESDWVALRRVVDALLANHPGVSGAAGLLARGGLMIRLLAASAPALLGAVDALWTLARARVLGLPPLALRKL
jgi:urease accessory protein